MTSLLLIYLFISISFPVKRRMEVLKLEDIEQEYMLVHARLQLLQSDPDSTQVVGKLYLNIRGY